jgi:DnaJ-class molecular chaperone
MNNATQTVEVTCWKCAGSGRYVFHTGRVEACYPCNGSGLVEEGTVQPSGPTLTSEQVVARIAADAEARERIIGELRNMYRNARAGHMTFEELAESYPSPATNRVLALFPKAVAAFRALGWPL